MTTRTSFFASVTAAQVEVWLDNPLILDIQAEVNEDGETFDCRITYEVPE